MADPLILFGTPSRAAPQRPERHPIPLDEALAQARALGWPEPLLTGKEDGPRPVPDYVGARGLQYSLQAMQEQAERRGDRFDILAVTEDFIGFGHRVGGETSFTRFRRWPYTTTPPWKRTAAAQAEEAS